MGVSHEYFLAGDRGTAMGRVIGPDGEWLGLDGLDVGNMDPHLALPRLITFAAGIPPARGEGPELVSPLPDEVPYPHETPVVSATAWDDGSFLGELPDAWRDALADVVEDAVPMLALQACDIAEAHFSDYLHAEDSIRTFVGLAQRARTEGAHLYCLTSL
ncbi:hypothetical protein ABT288_26645 [Streptomyces sp. NPDC001093]|uniref:hypothetical protein n=1 Tax=Streptomyces sp. NPDC001093 TaxID=3154376 RepID=UPI0033301688